MKTLTFNIICSLLFGMERGIRRQKLLARIQKLIEGIWSVPVNLPFTCYNYSLQASAKIRSKVKELIREKEEELEKGASPHQDLITCLLSIRGENNEVLTEKEIIDNVMLVMVAGHDTTAVLLTFMLRLLANDPHIHAAVLKGRNTSFIDIKVNNHEQKILLAISRTLYPEKVWFPTNFDFVSGTKLSCNCFI